jgi:hypothetical protein
MKDASSGGPPLPTLPRMPESAGSGNEVRSLNDLLDHSLRLARVHKNLELWWRGHGLRDWTLTPGVHRDGRTQRYERNVALRFATKAPTRYVKCPATDDLPGWLFLMQHYRLPTRLLDWTSSCLVAAFFAATDHPDQDGAIWALDPFDLNRAQIDTLRLLASDAPQARPLFQQVLATDTAPRPSAILALFATEVDPRMLIQQSAFTIHGDATPLESTKGAGTFAHKLLLPAAAKELLRLQLRLLGFSLHTLFPDLEHLARDLTDLDFNDPGTTDINPNDGIP